MVIDNEALIAFAQSALYALLIGVVGYVLGILASQFAKYLVTRFLESSWSNFASNLVRLVALIWTGQLMLEETGAAGLFVILATALTGAVAMGSESLAADTVSGVRLLMHRYYKVGDLVNLADQEGRVMEITLTSTVLKTQDRTMIVVPNSLIADGALINYSAIPGKVVNITIAIPLNQDIDRVTEVFFTAMKQFSPQYQNDECIPQVFLTDVAANNYYFTLKVYTPDELRTDEAEHQLRLLAIKTLLEHGIPFAQDEAE